LRLYLLAACSLFLSLPSLFASNIGVNPSTTLSVETGRNTSAASTFTNSSNGNLGAANISNVPISTLLYPGSTTKIYAHFMAWFGTNGHLDIGYNSSDPATVKSQVNNMLSRGISGVIIDWYGPESHEDATALAAKAESESHNGQFEFAIMQDAGGLNGCDDCTAAVIDQLNYVAKTYAGSASYIRWNGRPVVFFFGVENLPVDWDKVRDNVQGNPVFVFENSAGFARPQSNGAFSWVMPNKVSDKDPIAMNYLHAFYDAGQQHRDQLVVGATYKGFDDTVASWSADRHINQQCGQTWLQSFAALNQHYSSSNQLPMLQLVTWNDYEEGSEIESGVDNCLGVNADISGSKLSWNVTGNENTIDHYTVFISSDKQNLMPVGDFPAGYHEVDLGPYGFYAGNYTVYVKAVGKPAILNHMSGAVTYASTGQPATIPLGGPDFAVSAEQQNVTISKGGSGTLNLSLTSRSSFGGDVSMSCAGLPAGMSCSFSPSTVALRNSSAPVTVTFSGGTQQAGLKSANANLLYAASLPAFGTVLIGFGSFVRRNRKLMLVLLALCMIFLIAGCGGGSMSKSSTSGSPLSSTGSAVTIVATSGSVQHSTTVYVTMQ
jgi:hypothetical protein